MPIIFQSRGTPRLYGGSYFDYKISAISNICKNLNKTHIFNLIQILVIGTLYETSQ